MRICSLSTMQMVFTQPLAQLHQTLTLLLQPFQQQQLPVWSSSPQLGPQSVATSTSMALWWSCGTGHQVWVGFQPANYAWYVQRQDSKVVLMPAKCTITETDDAELPTVLEEYGNIVA